jgi:CheY-like chemotaxis protein
LKEFTEFVLRGILPAGFDPVLEHSRNLSKQIANRHRSPAASPGEPVRRRVVVADDEPEIRSLMTRCLADAHFDVVEANDGQQALEMIEQAPHPFDLLVTDMKMPGMDGLSLARSVAQRFPALPVLFVSGYLAESESVHRSEGTRWDFLAKPFLPKALLDKVESLLEVPFK